MWKWKLHGKKGKKIREIVDEKMNCLSCLMFFGDDYNDLIYQDVSPNFEIDTQSVAFGSMPDLYIL